MDFAPGANGTNIYTWNIKNEESRVHPLHTATIRKDRETHTPRGGRPLDSGRQLPPQLTVGRRPLGGEGASEGGFTEGEWGGV